MNYLHALSRNYCVGRNRTAKLAIHLLILIAISSPVLLVISSTAVAATITKSDTYRCMLEISGIIESGDQDKLLHFINLHSLHRDDVGEAERTVCLDSPGGSLSEGVKIAKYIFDDAIGTVIDDGKSCLSVCSLIFMMGHGRGVDTGFTHRTMHINAKLGFHRPALGLKKLGNYSAGEISRSFDLALDSVVEFLVLANKLDDFSGKPMILSDLVQNIFSHRGEDFYYIDTVNKAGRWNISLFGVPYPPKPEKVHAYQLCENVLGWPVGLVAELGPMEFGKSAENERVSIISSSPGSVTYLVSAHNAGVTGAECIVQFDEGDVFACGSDLTISTSYGSGECDAQSYEGKLERVQNEFAQFHPFTKLTELGSVEETPTPVSKPDEITNARCYVLSSGNVIDDEPCQIVTEQGEDHVTYFIWPSGGKTVIVGRGNDVKINGVDSVTRNRDGFDYCYYNSTSGNDFCYRRN